MLLLSRQQKLGHMGFCQLPSKTTGSSVFPTPPCSWAFPLCQLWDGGGQSFLYPHSSLSLSLSTLLAIWGLGNSASPLICVTWAGQVDLLRPHWQLTLFIPGIGIYLALIAYWPLLNAEFWQSYRYWLKSKHLQPIVLGATCGTFDLLLSIWCWGKVLIRSWSSLGQI